ncbi:MAG: Zn-dependent protease with chaperone function [Ilumatobacter sp.]|jgi:Zn-dependent protease with chaperone function
MCNLMARSEGARSVERSAIWAFLPVVAMAPFSLLALSILWLPVNMVFGLSFRWTVVVFVATGLLLFVRPFQTAVLTPILGARPAQPEESALIAPAWAEIAQANNLPPDRYVLRVLPSDELNAFACGGHLVVVTSFAAHELTPAQLRGVLAHELSHHLGLHTVAITIAHWLSGPVVFLARIGFFFENVSQAAAQSFGRHSPVIEVAGQFAATFFKAVSWVFTAALRAGDALGNFVGHGAEFEADKRAVAMGFGPELASALRQVLASGSGGRPIGWRARLAASHPAARTRVARIEALQRHPAR